MMMADALIDIPAIRRIDKLENGRRHSTGKVIIPSGGLTVLSRYLRSSQGSCHDSCKYGAGFAPETEPKIPRSPMRKTVVPKRGVGRNLERVSESNLGGTRKKTEITAKVSPDFQIRESDDPAVIEIAQSTQGDHLENVEKDSTDTKNSDDGESQKREYPAISVKPSCEDPVDIDAKDAEGEGEAENEKNAENESSKGEKNPPSLDSENQKPVDPNCVEGEISSSTDKESVLPVAHVEDSKLKPQSKPSSGLLGQSCPSGKQNSKGPKKKEVNVMRTNKGEMTISKGIRTSMIGDKKNVVASSVSLPPKVSDPSSPSMNSRTNKFKNVNRSKQQDTAKQIKPEKLRGKAAKRSDNVKGVSHSMDLKNVKKLNLEQAESPIHKTASDLIKSNPEKKPVESDQNNVVSIGPSSPSKDKSTKHNQNRTPTVRSPRLNDKKNMMYRPKGIHANGLPSSLSSFPGRKSLRPTPNGLKITQPSLSSLSTLSVSLMSSHNDTSTEHDKAVAEKQKSSSKMMYKARPKGGLMNNTSNNKNLPAKKLNFQRGKVIDIPVEDRTPKRLTFKKRELVDNRNDDNRKGKVEDWTPRRIKFKQRVNVDNINGDNQKGKVEEFTPRRLKFRPRVIVDEREGHTQNSRIEEFSPRKLEFRRKLIVNNINGDNQYGRVEEFSPRKLEFRRKLNVDNINGDNQNGRDEKFSPRRLEFRRKLNVDNINGDNQNGRVEEFSPRRLEFSRSVVDNRNVDDQNGRGEDSSPRKLVFRPKLVQNTKGSPTKNNSGGKEADLGWDNEFKIRSEKNSLRHRDYTERKGSGILYNNIIEQTASRLARTKASKVKALVSAFETVISHLDSGISETDNGN